MYKSELAKLAGVSPRTFRRYLATRRPILTAMGVSPFARKLPPPAVHYISEDYCIDIPDNTATLSNKTTTDLSDLTDYPPRQPIKTISRVPRYHEHKKIKICMYRAVRKGQAPSQM